MNSRINFFSDGISFQLKEELKIRKWINQVIVSENNKAGTINFIFCSDEFLLNLNKTYLKHNTYTDILTFPYSEEPKVVSGDIFISIKRVTENAKKYSQTFDQELCRILVHGILHLIGYNDKTKPDKLVMVAKEDQYLSEII